MNLCSSDGGVYVIPSVILLEKEGVVAGGCDVPRVLDQQQTLPQVWSCPVR